jgi:hypothetical protein
MTKEITIAEFITVPLKSTKFLLIIILIVGVVFLCLWAVRDKDGEAFCNIKYIIISDSTGTPIGTPQYRLNNFLRITDKPQNQFQMKLYHDQMTLVLKGGNATEIIAWANKNMPLFFELEFKAYKSYIQNNSKDSGAVITFATGISENTKHILEKIECIERYNKPTSKMIIVLFIFLSFFSALAIYVFECYVSQYLRTPPRITRRHPMKLGDDLNWQSFCEISSEL